MIKDKKFILYAVPVAFLIASLFIPFCIIEDYAYPALMTVALGNTDCLLISGFVALPITGVAILFGVVDLLISRKWSRILFALMTLLASVSVIVEMSEINQLINDSGFEFSYHTAHYVLGWFIVVTDFIIVGFLSFTFYTDFIKNGNSIKDKTKTGEKKEKKPSKFKRVLINTGRVNSSNYCGTLYGNFGEEPSNGYFVNLNKEAGLLIYGNNSDDLILTEDAVEKVVFIEKTGWYSYGPGEAIDLVFKITCKDGREGTLKLPIIKAKRDEKLMQEFRGDEVNKALNAIGIQGYDYRFYQVTGITSNNKAFNEFFVCQSDDELINELRNAYGSGVIKSPESLKDTKF